MDFEEKDRAFLYQLNRIATALEENNKLSQEKLKLLKSQALDIGFLREDIYELKGILSEVNHEFHFSRGYFQDISESLEEIDKRWSKVASIMIAIDSTLYRTQGN